MMKLVTIEEIQRPRNDRRGRRRRAALMTNATLPHTITTKGSDITLRDMGRPCPVGPGRQRFATFQEGLGPPRRQSDEKRRHLDLFGAQLRSLDGGYLRFFTALMLFY